MRERERKKEHACKKAARRENCRGEKREENQKERENTRELESWRDQLPSALFGGHLKCAAATACTGSVSYS